ncbi:hypothetical protein [Streptomyces candidus]|uniref:Uncharacterized protein n=1 Tax=Streptomyces candidus TaxID=67283 RepID=A0A7X0LSL5_9ACTN|nr:hypothetical protein [Streptomyces candidus]MBB6439380.1 hypothetical protein [Streptomyces candidus]GHH54970.1 hypothetical protein GCM10018773_58770 [Streptomyces candidus]
MTTTTTSTPAEERYEIGVRNARGRYPVTVDGQPGGDIHRFHGEWYARPHGHAEESRHDDRHQAAAHLADLVDSGDIDPAAPPAIPAAPAQGIVPWLSPRLKPTRRNILSAGIALGRVAELAWRPEDEHGNITGYPGSDNPWELTCCLDGKVVVRWWSHLRGRNGDNTPRPVWRHEGCIDFEDQAAKVAALIGEPPAVCPCQETTHPTTAEHIEQLLDRTERARKADDVDTLRPLLTQLLAPCPASSARAESMKTLLPKPKPKPKPKN